MSLQDQRTKLREHMMAVAKKYDYRFQSKISGEKLTINRYRIAFNIVNNSYIEVVVIQEGENVFRLRHFTSYTNTVNMTLNFINLNFLF